MRILIVCEGDAQTHDSWSGVTHSVLTQLREAGHTVQTADVDLYGVARVLQLAQSATISRRRWSSLYHLGPGGFRARSQRFAAFIREHGCDADVILQIGATFAPPAGLDVHVALFCDSNIEMSRRGAAGFSEASALNAAEIAEVRTREASVYRRASVIFTMSEMVRQSFISDFSLAPEKLVTIGCGPNFDATTIVTAVAPSAAAPTILFVGRDPIRKGADIMLSAFRIVREQIPDARLVMVGPPQTTPVPEGVDVTGFLDRDTPTGRAAMDAAYTSAQVFCLPTRFDAFGTSFVEAMAYGLPCVGPQAWAVPEIIKHGYTGLMVPPEDPQALAAALVTILGDDALRLRMGRAARERMLSTFAWPVLIARMVDSLRQVVEAGAQPLTPNASSGS